MNCGDGGSGCLVVVAMVVVAMVVVVLPQPLERDLATNDNSISHLVIE